VIGSCTRERTAPPSFLPGTNSIFSATAFAAARARRRRRHDLDAGRLDLAVRGDHELELHGASGAGAPQILGVRARDQAGGGGRREQLRGGGEILGSVDLALGAEGGRGEDGERDGSRDGAELRRRTGEDVGHEPGDHCG
jgi:hypothetical protein